MSALDDIKARVAAATPGPWEAHLSLNRKWMLILANSGTADEHRVGKIADDDDAELITSAPALLAALEAVEAKLKWLDAIQAQSGTEKKNINAGGTASVIRAVINEALEGAA